MKHIKDINITFRMSNFEYNLLDRNSKNLKISKSEYLRMLCRQENLPVNCSQIKPGSIAIFQDMYNYINDHYGEDPVLQRMEDKAWKNL